MSINQIPNPKTSRAIDTVILPFEQQIRAQTSYDALSLHLLNALSELLKLDVVIGYKGSKNRPIAFGANNVAEVSSDSPFIQAATQKLRTALRSETTVKPLKLSLAGTNGPSPTPFAMFVPLRRYTNAAPVGILCAKSSPWTESDIETLAYLTDVYAHAFKALDARKKSWRGGLIKLFSAFAIAVALLSLFIIKIPISVTAPAQVLPKHGVTLTSPVNGKVTRVLANEGDFVTKGQNLVEYDETEALNHLRIARQTLEVALTRKSVLNKKALVDPAAREEIAIIASEVALAELDVQKAQYTLDKLKIVAPRDGQIYSDDTQSLEEQSLAIGDPLFEIIDPTDLHIRADVHVQDGTLAYGMKTARIFLNIDPLNPIEVSPSSAPFEPVLDARGNVSYPVMLELSDNDIDIVPGVEGTVQLMGSEAPLGYVIFRRPLNWLRQQWPNW